MVHLGAPMAVVRRVGAPARLSALWRAFRQAQLLRTSTLHWLCGWCSYLSKQLGRCAVGFLLKFLERWRCTHCWLMPCSALAHSFAGMPRALGDVEVARFEGRHGTHHHPRLTFARGMSLMCRTACIDAYGRPGHTIFSMALRFDLNPTRELKNTILIALVCSAQCTGVLACIIDAISRDRLTVP